MTNFLKSLFLILGFLAVGFSQANAKEYYSKEYAPKEYAYPPFVANSFTAKAVIKNVTDRLGNLTIQIFKSGDEEAAPDQVIKVDVAQIKQTPRIQVIEVEGKDVVEIRYKNNHNKDIIRSYADVNGSFRLKEVGAAVVRSLGVLVIGPESTLEIQIHKVTEEKVAKADLGEADQTIMISKSIDPEQDVLLESGNKDFTVTYYDTAIGGVVSHLYTLVDGKFKLATL